MDTQKNIFPVNSKTPALPPENTAQEIYRLLLSGSIPADELLQSIRAGLNATRTINFDEQLETVPDYPTRHKFLSLLFEVMKLLKSNTDVIIPVKNSYNQTINISMLKDKPDDDLIDFVLKRKTLNESDYADIVDEVLNK